VRQAGRGGLLLAPALEAAQLDPEGQEVLEILSGWLNGTILLNAEPTLAYRNAIQLTVGKDDIRMTRREHRGPGAGEWFSGPRPGCPRVGRRGRDSDGGRPGRCSLLFPGCRSPAAVPRLPFPGCRFPGGVSG
jgi:hypothetical protein